MRIRKMGQAGRASGGSALIALAVVLGLLFGWHMWATVSVEERAREFVAEKLPGIEIASVSVQRITNIVSVSVRTRTQARSNDPLSVFGEALTSALGTAFASAFEPALEREVNLRAREQLDLYAMLLPYRIRVKHGDSS